MSVAKSIRAKKRDTKIEAIMQHSMNADLQALEKNLVQSTGHTVGSTQNYHCGTNGCVTYGCATQSYCSTFNNCR
jgi:hypothetical protein